MKWKQFVKLPEYNCAELDRNRVRFTGIGPRVHDCPGKIWPRDCINVEEECQKILNNDIKILINNEDQCDKIRQFIRKIFKGFKQCNIPNLFNKYCSLPDGHFDKVSFNVHYAIDCYASYNQILNLIHNIIRSINLNRTKKEDVCKSLFGSDRNYRIFKRHIKCLIVGNSKLRRVKVAEFIKFRNIRCMSIDLNKVKWLEGLGAKAKHRVYIQVIFAITKFIQELLRRFFYITIGNPFSEMLIYFRYDLWQKVQLKSLKRLIDDKVLHPFAIDGSISEIPFIATSKLKFFLKKDGLRLICTKYKDSKRRIVFDKSHAVLAYVLKRTLNYKRFTLNDLLEGLKRFRKKLIEDENAKIYFVRADIKDCFQSILQETLRSIVSKTLRSNLESDCIEMMKCKCFLKVSQRYLVRWSMEPNTLEEVNKKFRFIEKDEASLIQLSTEEFENEYLRPLIMNPVLRESKTSKNCFNLIKGLRQGCKFSPVLCSIYIQEAFNKYIGDFLKSEDCQVFHWVDDILFLSTDFEKAKIFMHKMLQGFKEFNLQMNLEKLACNFTCPNLDERLCRLKDYVIFYKQRISLDTLQCCYNYSYQKIELQYTFKVNPYCDAYAVEEIIRRARMDLIHFDIELNGLYQVVENIFYRVALLAHRIATIFLISFKFRNLEKQNPKTLEKSMKETAIRVYKNIKHGQKRNLITSKLSQLEIRFITAAAFLVTWQRNKVRHRTNELKKLNNRFSQFQMEYLITSKSDSIIIDNSTTIEEISNLNSIVSKLMKNFSTSIFANEVTLPSKI